jgi:hypothetical protein
MFCAETQFQVGTLRRPTVSTDILLMRRIPTIGRMEVVTAKPAVGYW